MVQKRDALLKTWQRLGKASAGDGTDWISVDDRLPKPGVPVLAYEPDWYDVAFPMMLNDRGQWVWWFDTRPAGRVSHWMPMPDLPQSREDQ